jgi:hypothetical protein
MDKMCKNVWSCKQLEEMNCRARVEAIPGLVAAV